MKKRAQPADDGEEESEESWTFIGDDSDPELVRLIAECEPKPHATHESPRREASPGHSHLLDRKSMSTSVRASEEGQKAGPS